MRQFDDPVLDAMADRRSVSKVGAGAPSDEELLRLMPAVTRVADHKSLRPWRLLTLRGDDRVRLGEALDAAAGVTRAPGEVNSKPLRADLLIAIVCSPVDNPKVPEWEQAATAAGIAHLLELALFRAGWGVMWRTGTLTNSEPVRTLHGLEPGELLMGWLYVGTISESFKHRMKTGSRPVLDASERFSSLPRRQ